MKKIAFILATGLLFFIAPHSAQAHADLTSSNPENGSVLTEVPSVVELTFSEELLPDTVEVAVTTESAGLLPNIVFSTEGNTVSLPWDLDLPGDTYQVAYRVVSNDGHPITGAISFSYPAAAAADSMASDSNESEPVTTSEVAAEETTADDSPGISPLWIAIAGLLIGAAIGYLMWRRGAKRTDN